MEKIMKSGFITAKKVASLIGNEDVILYDLRENKKYIEGHIPGAIMFSMDKEHFDNSQTKKNVIFYCEHGSNSYRFAEIIAKENMDINGYKVYSLYGGIENYKGKLCPSKNKQVDD